MPGTPQWRGLLVVLAGYAAGAAWYWLMFGLAPATGSEELSGGVLIAFVLPTAAAVLLWLFHAIEARRPVCMREPDDCAATERILFRILVFIAGLHGLVLLLLTDLPVAQNWGLQLTFFLVGGLLVSVGNLLPKTRPNVLVGVRTPRSLRSRHFWMEINRVAGYVAVVLGLVMIVAAVVLGHPPDRTGHARLRPRGHRDSRRTLPDARPRLRTGVTRSHSLTTRNSSEPAACASAEGVLQPTIAGASWTSASFVRAATMNRAKSTRRVMLLARMGSPTCRLQTGRPWLSPSSRPLPRTTVQRVSVANTRRHASTWSSSSTRRTTRPSQRTICTSALNVREDTSSAHRA